MIYIRLKIAIFHINCLMLKLEYIMKCNNIIRSLVEGILPDRLWLSLRYYMTFDKFLNWHNPKSLTEKMQWLKIYDRRPEYTIMVDKVKAKKWVSERIGDKYIIPILGVWEKAEDVDFDLLPDRFVIKCNHNSGTGMYICKDKSKMDKDFVIQELKKGLRENYYKKWREWPYKNVPRRIFAEKYMEDSISNSADGLSENVLTDYKFFCFNGEPFMMYKSKDYSEHTYTDFFDMNYQRLPIRMKDPNSNEPAVKPIEFEEMKFLARKLGQGVPFLRVDFYIIDHQVYFGELTFFHNAGFGPINPPEWNLKLGEMLNLENLKGKHSKNTYSKVF